MACLVLASCNRLSVQTNLVAERQAALNTIADGCGMPRTSWKLVDEDRVTLDLPADTENDRVICLLTRLQKSNLPMQLGFIGREYYAEPTSATYDGLSEACNVEEARATQAVAIARANPRRVIEFGSCKISSDETGKIAVLSEPPAVPR